MFDSEIGSASMDAKKLSNNLASAVHTQDSSTATSTGDRKVGPLVVAHCNASTAELALIPLHPAAKKQKLEAKQLPIVLGRTNVAAWWWKSCPCQHYCRLHCRPVAQNIRSLSKVMIQIDTAGCVHLVGKNRHLVTITPERDDNQLHVNDILSIGRPDREPWMRYQVIHKSMRGIFDKPTVPKSKSNSLCSIPITSQAAANETLHSSVPPTLNSNKHGCKPLSNKSDGDKLTTRPPRPKSSTNPPEWITTTSRKRKSLARSSTPCSADAVSSNASERSSHHASDSRLVENPDHAFGQSDAMSPTSWFQRTSSSPTQNNIGSATPSRSSNTKAKKSYLTQEEIPFRKRRRRQVDESVAEMAFQKNPRRNTRVGGIKGNRATGKDVNERSSGLATATANGDSNHRAHVHFVFQDYQTSASLLRETERKRKSDSSVSKASRMATSTQSTLANPGKGQSPRAFASDRSQLRILTKNFAAALVGAVSKTNEPACRTVEKEQSKNYEKMSAETPTRDSTTSLCHSIVKASTENATSANTPVLQPARSHVARSSKRSRWTLSSSEEYKNVTDDINEKKKAVESTRECTQNVDDSMVAVSNQLHLPNEKQLETTNAQESPLAFPQGVSSSFESGQGDYFLQGHNLDRLASPADDTGDNEEPAVPSVVASVIEKTEDASGTLQPTVDPIIKLKPWLQICQQEEAK